MGDRELVTRTMALVLDELRVLAGRPREPYLGSRIDEAAAECLLEIDPARMPEGLQGAARDVPEHLRPVHAHLERAG